MARTQDEWFEAALAAYGPALERLAAAYESEPDVRRDLLQDIHIALWRSLAGFDRRCSLRTWIYRVAHNVASSHVARQLRGKRNPLVGLEELARQRDDAQTEAAAGRRHALDRLFELIQKLQPLDRQVMLAYLEGMDAGSIAEISGLSAGNVATRIHRVKQLLARNFAQRRAE